MTGYLNSSSLRNGFDLLGKLTKGIKDMLIKSETKLDAPFHNGLFHIWGYTAPFRSEETVAKMRVVLWPS